MPAKRTAEGFSPAVSRVGIVLISDLMNFRLVVWPSLAGSSFRDSGVWGHSVAWKEVESTALA